MTIVRLDKTKGTKHAQPHKKNATNDFIVDDNPWYSNPGMKLAVVLIIAAIIVCIIGIAKGSQGYDSDGVAVKTTNASTNIRNAEKNGQVLAKADQYVYVDVSTGVQYIMEDAVDSGGACLMVDADGKTLINKTWKRLHSDDEETDSGGNESSADDVSKSTSADASQSDTDTE